MKLAILDDYQNVARKYADWSSLKGVEVTVSTGAAGRESSSRRSIVA
jgi:hypothetical protein